MGVVFGFPCRFPSEQGRGGGDQFARQCVHHHAFAANSRFSRFRRDRRRLNGLAEFGGLSAVSLRPVRSPKIRPFLRRARCSFRPIETSAQETGSRSRRDRFASAAPPILSAAVPQNALDLPGQRSGTGVAGSARKGAARHAPPVISRSGARGGDGTGVPSTARIQ